MGKMRESINQKMERLKLIQEECKTVAMFIGAIGSVYAFVSQFIKKDVEKVVSRIPHHHAREAIGGGASSHTPIVDSVRAHPMLSPESINNTQSFLNEHMWKFIFAIIAIAFIVFFFYYFAKSMKKRMNVL